MGQKTTKSVTANYIQSKIHPHYLNKHFNILSTLKNTIEMQNRDLVKNAAKEPNYKVVCTKTHNYDTTS
jgi:hypothetical protein